MEEAQPQRPWRAMLGGRLLRLLLAGIGIASASLMLLAARLTEVALVTCGAALFASAAILAAVISSWQMLKWPASPHAPLVPAYVGLLRNAWLAAICYGWGALAMQGLYLTPLTGLKWQHGWQYALAMALLCAASIVFARSMMRPLPGSDPRGWQRHFRWAVPAAVAQAAIAAGGLGVLWLSGKLYSTRADWAANRVFAALAIAILAVSIATVVSHRRLLAASRSP